MNFENAKKSFIKNIKLFEFVTKLVIQFCLFHKTNDKIKIS